MVRRVVPLVLAFLAGVGVTVGGTYVLRARRRTSPAVVTRPSTPAVPLPRIVPPAPPLASLDAAPPPVPPRMFRLDPQHTGRSGYRLPHAPHQMLHIATGARISSQAVVAREGHLLFGSHDGVLYDAERATGRVAWRFNTADRIYPTPLVLEGGSVLVGSDVDRVFALTSTGALEVALATDDDADTSVVLVGDG
ncbi:MAG: PQQ-binding-like beta-propeller repeat protein, partial [Deltaproteobacteria bacterium]